MTLRDSAALVLQTVAGRRADPALLDVMMRLFDGHDIPAMWWDRANRRPGFYPSHGMSRALAFEAHLLGAVISGTYPFRGVTPWCRCEHREHTCDGLGTRYLLLDLDAKNGEGDTEARTRRVLKVCWNIGLLPVVFSSRSGNGAHIFLFLSRSVTTRDAFDAGKALMAMADIRNRCDVIPSAAHRTGLGTLHALPFSPLSEAGGGVLFDSHLRPVPREQAVATLRWAEQTRSPAGVVEALAAGNITYEDEDTKRRCEVAAQRRAHREERYSRETPLLSKRDSIILKSMKKRHPQFRRALATPAESWRGKRSSRDAYLAGYLRRQGMSSAGVVRALMELPDTKAAERGEDYAWALVESQANRDELTIPVLAGEPLRPAAAKQQRQAQPWAPWAARLGPPLVYGGTPSPWWSEGVQTRLKDARSRLDGIVLAYLVDRYYRGPMQQRMFFCGQRTIGKTLRIPARSTGAVVARLADRFSDVLRVVDGVPHPTLRLARGFYVPESRHRDSVDWYLAPVRSHQGMLVCQHAGGVAGNGSDQSQHGFARASDELPF